MPTLSGTVKDTANAAIARTVRVYKQSSGAFVGQVTSDAVSGIWSVTTADTKKHFAIEHDGRADLAELYLSLLMWGNGANGGTTFTDEKGHTVNRVGTVTTTSTAQSKFDGSSILNTGTGGHINVDGSAAEFTFGTGDFTIEMWVYLTDISSSCQLLDWRPLSTEGKYPGLRVKTDGKLEWHSDTAVNFSSTSAITEDAWFHIAVTRTGGSIRFFINGVLDATVTADSTNFLGGSSVRPCFGYGPNPGVSFPIVGHLNSIAVYKGFAKYTATFDLPTWRAGDMEPFGENALIYDNLTPA